MRRKTRRPEPGCGSVLTAFRLLTPGLAPLCEVAVDDLAIGASPGECASRDIDPGLVHVERGLDAQLLSDGSVEIAAPPGDVVLGMGEL